MQGIWVDGNRPRTKKALKDALASDGAVSLEATSLFGNEYDGPIESAPDGKYYVVGPDPVRARTWYAEIIVSNGKITVK